MEDLTPALRQYVQIKERYPDCILFFRMGDFYEMFFEDARTASPVLEVALTTREKNKENPVPMCGVPYHAADVYIAKLLKGGFKVAVCEQMEDPSTAKGIIRREVVRVVTPGLISEIGQLEEKEPNYIASIVGRDGAWGAAFLDFSTGELKAARFEDVSELTDELFALGPKEAVLPEDLRPAQNSPLLLALGDALVNYVDPRSFEPDAAEKTIVEVFGLAQVDGLGLSGRPMECAAIGGLLRYVSDYQRHDVAHISRPRLYTQSQFMVIDEVTRRNLELTKTIYEGAKRGSLLSLIDRTVTPMGGRLVREWINYPLVDAGGIERRLDAVGELLEKRESAGLIREGLSRIADLERLVGRVSLRIAGGRDLVSLSDSLKEVPMMRERLSEFGAAALAEIREGMADFSALVEKIDATLVETPPHSVREGGLIKDGVDEELDELREISRSGKDWIIRLEAEERKRTGIGNLKVRFNKVFGYYIEVTNSYLPMVPADYIRKQTLVGAERFITPELKEYEAKVLGAEDRIKVIEHDLFVALRDEVRGWIAAIKKVSGHLAALDVMAGLAAVAADYGYARPEIDDGHVIAVTEGRHPMVERSLPTGAFVPNDITVDPTDRQLLIITGPNMAGKSTIIRQLAIIVLMAQMGSFVPARGAKIGIVDRIFARVGASDSLVRGQSTFMVEMVETANILNNATERSLVILDEIGRGTSTFDGISIAWAVAEHIHDCEGSRPRTLFATHFHELTELAAVKERVHNYHVAVREWNERIIFLRKLEEGVSSHSYGIEVARLAGIPPDVIGRAREILENLERGEFTPQGVPTIAAGGGGGTKKGHPQLDLFSDAKEEIIAEIGAMDIYRLTPLEVMKKVDELREKIKKMEPK